MPSVAVRKTREEMDSDIPYRSQPYPSSGVSGRVSGHVSGRVSAGHAAAAAAIGPRPPPVEPSLKKFGPITLEKYLAKKERSHTRKRERLNHQRVEMLCHPFHVEQRAIMNRRTNVIRAVNRLYDELRSIQSLMPGASHSSKRKNDIEQLQDMYMLERLQKKEEIMRLTDRVIALRTIIENIHRQHEIPYVERPSAFGFGGGAPNKTEKNKHKHKHKWSLKYKRSTKGFSQRQHCKYGRKNVTKKH